jgi:hypothetical protein
MLERHEGRSGLDVQEIGDKRRGRDEMRCAEPHGGLLIPVKDEMGDDGHLGAAGGGLPGTDIRAFAGLSGEEAMENELVDCLADGLAGDAENFGDLAFGGQAVARGGEAGVDLLEDRLLELEVERLRSGLVERGLEHAWASGSSGTYQYVS